MYFESLLCGKRMELEQCLIYEMKLISFKNLKRKHISTSGIRQDVQRVWDWFLNNNGNNRSLIPMRNLDVLKFHALTLKY